MIIKDAKVKKEKELSRIVKYNNVGMREIVEDFRSLIEKFIVESTEIILIGDFNAKIGKWRLHEKIFRGTSQMT